MKNHKQQETKEAHVDCIQPKESRSGFESLFIKQDADMKHLSAWKRKRHDLKDESTRGASERGIKRMNVSGGPLHLGISAPQSEMSHSDFEKVKRTASMINRAATHDQKLMDHQNTDGSEEQGNKQFEDMLEASSPRQDKAERDVHFHLKREQDLEDTTFTNDLFRERAQSNEACKAKVCDETSFMFSNNLGQTLSEGSTEADIYPKSSGDKKSSEQIQKLVEVRIPGQQNPLLQELDWHETDPKPLGHKQIHRTQFDGREPQYHEQHSSAASIDTHSQFRLHDARSSTIFDTESVQVRRSSARCASVKAEKDEKLKNQLQYLETTMENLQEEIRHHHSNEIVMQADMEVLQAKIAFLEGESETIKQRNKDLQLRNAELTMKCKVKLKEIQTRVFHDRELIQWNIPADDQITCELKTMDRMIKAFVNQELRVKYEDFSAEFLSQSSLECPDFITKAGKDFVQKAKLEKSGIVICLSAWITLMIYAKVFRNGLGYLDYLRVNGGALRQVDGTRKTMLILDVLSKYYGAASAEYTKLRSDVVRLLEPSVGGLELDVKMRKLESKVQEAQNRFIHDKAKEILGKIHLFLKISHESKAQERMTKILNKAMDISKSLYAQRCRIDSVVPRAFAGEFTFSSSFKRIEHHPTHLKDVDDTHCTLEGKPVLVLTSPILLAIGASDGSDPDRKRTLKKGVVWMGPRNMLDVEKESKPKALGGENPENLKLIHDSKAIGGRLGDDENNGTDNLVQ